LPPGEAFYIRRGHYRRLKLADPQAAPLPAARWVEMLKKRG
jgi:hypothetical protein